MTAREGRTQVPGGAVWYRIVGDGPGVPLLALHGGPGTGSGAFQPLEELGRQRPVVVYDQLGAGRSDRPEDPSLWRLDRFVAEVDAVRRALRLDEIHLLGHSWGGMLAIEYLLGQPTGIRSLALCGALASVAEFEREVHELVQALPPDVVSTLRKHEDAGTTSDAEYFGGVMTFLRRHLCRLDPWPDVLLQGNPMETPAYRAMWGFNEFTISGNLRGWDRTPRLGEIRVPTLITCGRYDEATPTCAATLHKGIPGSKLYVFEACSHMTFLERPEEFVRIVGEFLVQHDDSRSPVSGKRG